MSSDMSVIYPPHPNPHTQRFKAGKQPHEAMPQTIQIDNPTKLYWAD
jgi:hypothetical protein